MNVFLLASVDTPYATDQEAYIQDTARQWSPSSHHRLTCLVFDPRGPRIHIHDMNGVRMIRFSAQYFGDRGAFLGPIARASFLLAEMAAEQITSGNRPDMMEIDGYQGLAHMVLQRRHTRDSLFDKIIMVVRVEHLVLYEGPLNRAPMYTLSRYWATEMERFALKAADRVITSHAPLQDRLEHDHIVKGSLLAPLPKSSNKRQAERVRNPATVLFRAPLQPAGGIDSLLQGMQQLWKENVAIPCWLVGPDTPDFLSSGTVAGRIARQYAEDITAGRLIINVTDVGDGKSNSDRGIIQVFLDRVNPHGPELMAAVARGELVVVADSCDCWTKEDGVYPVDVENPDAIAAGIREILDGRRGRSTEPVTPRHEAPWDRYQKLGQDLGDRIEFPFIRPGEQSVLYHLEKSYTVVVPFYNLGAFVRETLDSIYASSVAPEAVIVVNDGSTDPQSLAAVWDLSDVDYPGLTVIHQSNQGIIAARQCGALSATTPYVAFLDADDRVDARYYDRALAILDGYENVSFVGAWAQYFGEASGVWPGWNPEFPYMLYHNLINSSAIVVRRDVYLDYGVSHPLMQAGLEDYQSILSMMANGHRGVVIPAPLFYYRVRRNSRSKQAPSLSKTWALHETLTTFYPQLYQEFALPLINLLSANGPGYRIDSPLLF